MNQKGVTSILFFLIILVVSAGIIGGALVIKKYHPNINSQNKKPAIQNSNQNISPSPTNSPATWKVFNDNVNNVEIKYPNDWLVTIAGSRKISNETLEQYVEATEKLPPLSIRAVPSGSFDNPQPVSKHEQIVKEIINPVLKKRTITAYTLKDTVNVLVIQGIPPGNYDLNESYPQNIIETFNQILSTFKFTQ